jgi:general secretion pathway protein D
MSLQQESSGGRRCEDHRSRTRRHQLSPALYRFGAALGVVVLLVGCAQQRVRNEAERLIAAGQFERANELLEQGVKEHSDSALLRAGLVQARNEAQARLIAQGLAARSTGKLDEAETIFKRALPFDSNGRAQSLLQELAAERRQRKALADAQALVAKRQTDAALALVNEPAPRRTRGAATPFVCRSP